MSVSTHSAAIQYSVRLIEIVDIEKSKSQERPPALAVITE